MSLWNWIENARNKSEKDRRAIALISSVGITVVIALFWVLGSSFSVGSDSQQVAAVGLAVEAKSPFVLFSEQLGSIGTSIKAGAEEVTRQFKSLNF